MSAFLTSAVAKLNPFAKRERDEDDHGEALEAGSVAGGGHASRVSHITRKELRVSHALKTYIVNEQILSAQDVNLDNREAENSGALKEMLDNPHIHVPSDITNRDHPLTEYFISSSHNTYLMAGQLYGSSSAVAYETALNAGSRCVEIDAWDNSENPDEPKVTHGWTLASRVPFRTVCETIRDALDKEATQPQQTGYAPAPILISLENHCDERGQLRLSQIMREVWGDRLLSKEVRDEGTREQDEFGEHVDLIELGSKIAVIVEYHLPEEADSDTSDDEDEDEQARIDHEKYRREKKESAKGVIIPELAELGVYAQSVKPANNSWFDPGTLQDGPNHHLINVSESGLLGLNIELNGSRIGTHNAKHLMRVYPKGTRISSRNLNPVPFWGVGAQICALNWQTFDASMQLNEALFAGSDGYVLKPAPLRSDGSGRLNSGKKKHLRVHVAGATDVPVSDKRDPEDEIKPYVTCTLVHPDDVGNTPPKRKTSGYKQHKLGLIHKGEQPPPTDPIWDEQLDWDFAENELVFLRILIKSDDKFARNPVQCVAAVRLSYVRNGEWCFVRMLDLKGKETHCTVLLKFEITDA